MISTPTDLKEYFRAIGSGPLSLKDIKSFYYGENYRPIDGTKNESVYPILWMEPSQVRFQNTTANFSVALNVMTACQQDDIDEQDAAINKAYEILCDIFSLMENDSKGNARVFSFKREQVVMDEIHAYGSDYCYGMVAEFPLSGLVDLCFNPLKWNGRS